MGKRGKRTRRATGIYLDRYGHAIVVGGVEHRGYARSMPLEELRRERNKLLRDWEDNPDRVRATKTGTLDAYFASYLDTIPNVPRRLPDGRELESARRRNERALWRYWQRAGFGTRVASEVTPLEIRQQLATFETQPRAKHPQKERKKRTLLPLTKGSIKHLRRILSQVYDAVNGKSGFNPVRDVPAITVRYDEPRAIPYELIDLIWLEIPNYGRPVKGTAKKKGGPGRPTFNATKIRLQIEAYTGRPPAEIGRIQPRDIDLSDKSVRAHPRRKGAGSPGRRLPLNDRAVEAFRLFVKYKLHGPYDARSANRTFMRAVNKVRAKWEASQRAAEHHVPWPLPDNVRAYDLRHSFATAVLRESKNLKAVAEMLLHASLDQSRRYTLAAVDDQLREVAEAMSRGTTLGTAKRSNETGA